MEPIYIFTNGGGGFMRGWVLLHYSPHSRVRTLNPDIIQKLSLRESWQRNCRSPPPPNPCEKLAEIYSTICRSADFWRETGRRSTICRSADLLREPDGDLRWSSICRSLQEPGGVLNLISSESLDWLCSGHPMCKQIS